MSLLAAMNQIETKFTAWARSRNDIRAAIVVGSRARTDHPADEWADLDVAIMTTAAPKYHRDTKWISEIAETWAVAKDPGGVTYHVLFAGGLDAGIAIIPATPVKLATRVFPLARRIPVLGGVLKSQLAEGAAYTARGCRVLFDKDGTAERFLALFQAPEPIADPRPTPAEFDWVVNEFWFTALWTAKHLWRGELWRARNVGPEGRMKHALLKLIEWDAQSRSPRLDTWEDGRFIEEWAAPDVLADLQKSFADYSVPAQERALASMIMLFSSVSDELAKLLGYDNKPELARSVTAWIQQHQPVA